MSPKRIQWSIGGLPQLINTPTTPNRRWRRIAIVLIILLLAIRPAGELLASVGIIGSMTCENATLVMQAEESEAASRMEAARFIYRDAAHSIRVAKDHMIQLEKSCNRGTEVSGNRVRHLLNRLVIQLNNDREKGRDGWSNSVSRR